MSLPLDFRRDGRPQCARCNSRELDLIRVVTETRRVLGRSRDRTVSVAPAQTTLGESVVVCVRCHAPHECPPASSTRLDVDPETFDPSLKGG